MKIGVDLDDVLLNFNDALIPYQNIKYGTSYQRKDHKSFNLEDTWGVSHEEARKRIHDFYQSYEHMDALPVNGSLEAISAMAKDNRLYVVTAKPLDMKDKTLEWIEKHFPNLFEGVHFTRETLLSENKKKSEICKKLGIEVFIDDSIHNAEDIVSVGIPVFLLDCPWNQGELPNLVTRVYSWEEILKNIH